MPNSKKANINASFFILMVFVMLIVDRLYTHNMSVANISYDQFQSLLKQGAVAEVIIGEEEISGTLKEANEDDKKHFVTARIPPELAKDLTQYDVSFSGSSGDGWLVKAFSWLFPLILFATIWFFLMRMAAKKGGMGGGFMTVGKSKAKIYVENDTKVTFSNVAGVEESIVELKEVVGFLKEPKTYSRLGAKIPKGVLLVGPPGTGKTLLARAVAGEAAVPFFTISGSEFVEMFVGVGAARVRDLFEQARKKAPCIIFIDELDALGKARSAHPMSGGHDEKEQTLNQLLVELDGFDSSSGIVLLAATNRPEILDPALLRAGRFDRQILVDRPDKTGRFDILKVHSKKIMLDSRVDLEQIAAMTPGFTGADLANLVNEAALIATRRSADSVAMDDFTSAIERIIAGLEKRNRLLNPLERKIVAIHEMGHAIVSWALPGSELVHKISIIPRGIGSLGYTIQRPTEDRYLMTTQELKNKMAVLLGGRAAELVAFDHLSTGAADDIAKVTDIARAIVSRYGMAEKLGHGTYEEEATQFLTPGDQQRFRQRTISEETIREIDCAVRQLIDESFQRAKEILVRNHGILSKASALLLERETLNESDLQSIKADVKHQSDWPQIQESKLF